MKENIETKKEISKIHFLVHPGYMAKYNNTRGPTLESYVEKASSLPLNEMMVVFTPGIGINFINEVRNNGQKYVDVIKQIKKVLGNRAIILADEDFTDDRSSTLAINRDWIWNKIKKIAEKRGFVFSKNLTAEAYGEYLKVCVAYVASNMQEAAQIDKVEINKDLSSKSS